MSLLTRLIPSASYSLKNVVIKISNSRTFLSPAYYCNEVWEQRLEDPLLKKVDLDVFYSELDQKYQKIRNISAVDVDIFANAVKTSHQDELLDIIHKLRLSADTCNTLESTHHAVVRSLLNDENNHELLLQVLDDRLNYGIFLDHFTCNLLLDTFWKKKDFVSGSRTASQLMYQEDFSHPLNKAISLLHCYNYLLNPKEWPKEKTVEEPEEEVKVRVKFVRNPYFDDHFDLKDPMKIVGKTLTKSTLNPKTAMDKSLHLLGLSLWDKPEKVEEFLSKFKGEKMYKEIIELIPDSEGNKKNILESKTEAGDVQKLLQDEVKKQREIFSERDVAMQCDLFIKWGTERQRLLQEQNERYMRIKRIENVEETQKTLKEREQLLWFFENQEKIELQIEANLDAKENMEKETEKVQTQSKSKSSKNIDENYIPPEIRKQRN